MRASPADFRKKRFNSRLLSTAQRKEKSFGWPLSHSPFDIFNLIFRNLWKLIWRIFAPQKFFLESRTAELRNCSSSKLFWGFPNELHKLNLSEYKKEQDLSQSPVRQKYQLIRNFRDSFGSNSLTWHIQCASKSALFSSVSRLCSLEMKIPRNGGRRCWVCWLELWWMQPTVKTITCSLSYDGLCSSTVYNWITT